VLPVRAIIFDFNGTLSDDEPVLCEIFRTLFAEYGRPMSAQEYYDRLCGLSDPEIVGTWLGRDFPDIDGVIEQRIARYRAAVADGSTVIPAVRAAVRYAARRVPVGLVSGSARSEIEPVLSACGIAPLLGTLVAADDVARGKPDPEGYLRALDLLNRGITAAEIVVLEDTEAGVAAAKAAGMRCVAVAGTLAPERLAAADDLVERIDVELMRRLLG
jgi:beta-phosphoglucomutase